MVLDFHVHIFPPAFIERRESLLKEDPGFKWLYGDPGAKMAGRDQLLRVMDEDGVDKAVVFGFPWSKEDHYMRHNDYVLESVNRHPDRLIGFGCFSPLSPGAAREAERCLLSGLSGIGEIGFYGEPFREEHLELLKEVLQLCEEQDAPFMLHANEPVGHSYKGKTRMGLACLYAFLKAYPRNRVVLAHWGGGLFFYALMKKEVGEVFKNTWFDTAATPYLYKPEIYWLASEIVGAERVLFGSDYPLIRPGRYLRDMRSSRLSSEQMEQITGVSGTRLLKVPDEEIPKTDP